MTFSHSDSHFFITIEYSLKSWWVCVSVIEMGCVAESGGRSAPASEVSAFAHSLYVLFDRQ